MLENKSAVERSKLCKALKGWGRDNRVDNRIIIATSGASKFYECFGYIFRRAPGCHPHQSGLSSSDANVSTRPTVTYHVNHNTKATKSGPPLRPGSLSSCKHSFQALLRRYKPKIASLRRCILFSVVVYCVRTKTKRPFCH